MEDSNLVLDEKKNKKLHFIEQDLLNVSHLQGPAPQGTSGLNMLLEKF